MAMPMQWLPVSFRMLVGFVLFSLFWGSVWSDKVCTNSGVPSQYQSHTLRHELLTSKNTPWGKQDLAQLHLINNDDHTLSNSVRRKILSEHQLGWNILDRKKKNSGGLRGTDADILKEVSLHDVRLDPDTIHGLAQQTNLEYLLMLDVDRLVWSFRKNAGLDTPGVPYGGWENPDGELRGHFVGHYLSASAKMWASTHNADLFQKMSSVISALSVCQTKMGTGYLSAFPSELFDRFEALEEVWAPYYTIHKILAGLLDQYSLADNTQALNITLWMTDYFYNRVQNVIAKHTIERHWLSLNEETGGMNDVLYRLYTITGDEKHLQLAHLFDKPCFLGLLALKADDISGFHANTHIPIVIGSQMRYEITGEPLFKEIGEFFMSIVNSSHSYATGGTSVSEFWSDPKRLADALGTENQESCTTYNMLKVSRHLFRWTKEMSYADYYERALTNGVLGIQRGREPGVMIYMLPMHRGASKAKSYHGWGTKFNSFWCCYGTGIESFSKLGDSIYFEDVGKDSTLYVIQYISSSLDWRSGQVLISQHVEPAASWNQRLKVKISISAKELADTSTLRLRIPLWTSSNGSSASLNGEELSLPAPGNFLSLTKSWSTGDIVSLDLPVTLRTEAIKDDRPEFTSVQAFLYGPYLLAGLSSGDWDFKMNPNTFVSDSITPIPADYNSNLITLTQGSSHSVFALTNSNQLITMATYPEPGTDSALAATFRLIVKNPTLENSRAANGDIDRLVMLEPIDFPGMMLSHQGEDKNLRVSSGSSEESSVFRLIPGLDGEGGTVSLESESNRGCFIYSDLINNAGGANVTLNCSSAATPADTLFQKAASFALQNGVSEYHDISFVATGLRRNFLLVPLFSLRDESYTVYFNVTA